MALGITPGRSQFVSHAERNLFAPDPVLRREWDDKIDY